MPDEKPSHWDWMGRVFTALFIGWIVLGLTTCEPPRNYPGNDCRIIGPGVEIGSDC